MATKVCDICKQPKPLADFVTREEYDAYLAKPCTYCGYPLCETGIGLDRIDNSIPFTLAIGWHHCQPMTDLC